jgi:ribonuclease E
MANKMLIDTTHPEETRVVVTRGNRVEEFDFESASRRQLRGNIYLAKVTRVEPSLQAAFIEYGGNRHGFLAFSEIHPDYYQIPVADRQALIDEEERAQRAADDEADRRARRPDRARRQAAARREPTLQSEQVAVDTEAIDTEAIDTEAIDTGAIDTGAVDTEYFEVGEPSAAAAVDASGQEVAEPASAGEPGDVGPDFVDTESAPQPPGDAAPADSHTEPTVPVADADVEPLAAEHHAPLAPAGEYATEETPPPPAASETQAHEGGRGNGGDVEEVGAEEDEGVESVGGADALEEVQERMPRFRRQYKIQEVIKRRQVMLVQVVKEERGTKGAALTTYLSLAGRYSVLMPNTARGGGISRKITSAEDRKRLKQIATDLEVPEGMGVILRTAGANRTKAEVKRDFEYLLRMWETVRDLTLKSTAPMLVYEEGSLIKRAIRDLYNKDIDEIVVAGDDGYREAKDFMRMLMPSHAKNVKPYKDTQPLLTRFGVESQLDAMFSPVVQLRSGGYIVINQAEALVAIDVNSGRATREHHIEDTALKTNLEAAEEISRQLRLRDLAGLIVIDFIDMDEKRNNRSVERKLKECLKHDRARIQVGRISHFGLLEMSRQRIRTSVLESSTEKCSHCGGTGHVRSVGSVTLQLLRALEETLLKGATHNLIVRTRADIALYVLNHKRAHLRDLETRFRISMSINADAAVNGQTPYVIERGEQVHSVEAARAIAVQPATVVPQEDDLEEDDEASADEPAPEARAGAEVGENGGRRRRRRRRRRRSGEPGESAPAPAEIDDPVDRDDPEPFAERAASAGANGETGALEASGSDAERRRRRRGRRGGRRNRRDHPGESPAPIGADPAVADGWHEWAQSPQVDAIAPPPSFAQETAAEPAAIPLPPPEPPPEPSPATTVAQEPSETAPEPPEPPEPPRRRSTVRERAPVALDAGTAEPSPAAPPATVPPEPEPVASMADEPADDRPRRTGWWSKRVAGKS